MDDGLGIRPGGKFVSARKQFLAKVGVVIDFAIKHDPDGAVLVADRLMTSGDVDDAEPPMPQPNPEINEDALVIGTAMTQRLVHAMHRFPLHDTGLIEFEDSANSAHSLLQPEPPVGAWPNQYTDRDNAAACVRG